MKFGVRKPSLKKKIAARTSVKRMVRAKVRVPRGYGFVTNPKKATYNRVYNRTSISAGHLASRGARKSSKALKQGTGHGFLWWCFIGWWFWTLKLEIYVGLWLYRKFKKPATQGEDPHGIAE